MSNSDSPPVTKSAARRAARKANAARRLTAKGGSAPGAPKAAAAKNPAPRTGDPTARAAKEAAKTVRKGPNETLIAETILRLVDARGPGKTICPSEVARDLGGPQPEDWSPLMQPVRRVAVQMVKAGQVAILRKGKRVEDPDDFRGIYRLGTLATETDEA